MFPADKIATIIRFLRGVAPVPSRNEFGHAILDVLSWAWDFVSPQKAATVAKFTIPAWLIQLLLDLLGRILKPGATVATEADDEAKATQLEGFCKECEGK